MRRLMLVGLLGFTSFCLTLAALPSWAVQGGASTKVAGTVTSVMLAATVLTQLWLPRVLVRWGTTRTLVGGLLALGAPAPLLALTHGMGVLLVVSAVRGVGFAVLTVVGSLLTARVAAPERRGESVGLYGLAAAVPNLAAVPAGVALTLHGGFGWVALGAAAPVLAVPAAAALGRDHPERNSRTAAAPSRSERRTSLRAVAAPAAVLGAATLAAGGLVTFLPIARPQGATATVALLLLGLGSAVTRWRVGAVADRVGVRLLTPAALCVAVGGLLLVATALDRGWDAAVVVGAVVFGAGYGVLLNLTLVAAFARAGAALTTASALWNAAFDAGTAVGAGALGALTALGVSLPGAFALAAAIMVAALPAALHRHRYGALSTKR